MNDLIKQELLTDEYIIWSGQPDGSKIFSKADFFLIPFSLLWGGFAITWEMTVLGFDAPLLFKLWGLPFVAVGLYMIFGRFIYKAKMKKKTYYYVTNKRVISLKNSSRVQVEAEFITSLPAVNKSVNSSGSGDIIFGSSQGFLGMNANSGMAFMGRNNRYGNSVLSFFDLKNANEVHKIVNEIRNGTYL